MNESLFQQGRWQGILRIVARSSDIYELLSSGDVPKDAWINPQGGHLGRQVGVWPDPRIFKQVILPWLDRTLKSENTMASPHN